MNNFMLGYFVRVFTEDITKEVVKPEQHSGIVIFIVAMVVVGMFYLFG